MKTLIGALIGIAVIIIIVMLARSGHKQAVVSDATNTVQTSTETPVVTQPVTPVPAPASSSTVTQPN